MQRVVYLLIINATDCLLTILIIVMLLFNLIHFLRLLIENFINVIIGKIFYKDGG